MNQNKVIISLINNVIYNREIETVSDATPDKEQNNFENNQQFNGHVIDKENIDYGRLFITAQSQKLFTITYLALKNNADRLNIAPDVLKLFEKAYKAELIHSSNLDFMRDELVDLFDSHNVKYMLLKGSVLRELYPKPFYRTMSDIDVLYDTDETANIDKILQDAGFEKKDEKEKDKIYTKYSLLLEVHKSLMDSESEYSEYLSHVWDRAVLKNGCEYEMKNEDFLIYHIIHMVKHFTCGGIGIRFFLDLQLFLDEYALTLDYEYLNSELEKLKLKKFYEKSVRLSEYWFKENAGSSKLMQHVSNSEKTDLNNLHGQNSENADEAAAGSDTFPTDDDKAIMNFVFNGGIYGSLNANIAIRKAKEQEAGNLSTGSFILKNIFPGYSKLKSKYAWLKSPLLLPAGWIKLNFSRMLRWRVSRDNAKLMASDQSEEIDTITKMFKELDLM